MHCRGLDTSHSFWNGNGQGTAGYSDGDGVGSDEDGDGFGDGYSEDGGGVTYGDLEGDGFGDGDSDGDGDGQSRCSVGGDESEPIALATLPAHPDLWKLLQRELTSQSRIHVVYTRAFWREDAELLVPKESGDVQRVPFFLSEIPQ